MKRFFLLATFVCAALFSSCEGYDDSELVNRLNDFETRLKQLEETCKQLNANISSLQTIVNAIQKNDQISTVAPISKDGKEIGYSIVFTSGKSITIYHGTDGQNGQNGTNGSNGQNGADGHTPVIGVKMDADGIYYWTIDGEWLTDENGNKIQASPSEADSGADGKDGVTPQLKIENEYWYVSYDNGQTWIKLGKATGEQGEQGPQGSTGAQGDSFFQDIIQDDDCVYFILADGTVLTVEKKKELALYFDTSSLTEIAANSEVKVDYTVVSSANVVDVEVVATADLRAEVIADDNTKKSGHILIRTGSSYDAASKVIVFVSDGDKVIMKSISLQVVPDSEAAQLYVYNGATKSVSASGGTVTLSFLTNVDCEAVIPSDASSWISVDQSRALEHKTIKLNVAQNTSDRRSATVKVQSLDGKLSVEYTISQAGTASSSNPDVDNDGVISGTPAANEIFYTSKDGKVVTPNNPDVFGAVIVSNTYANGLGVIVFDRAVSSVGDKAFYFRNNLTNIVLPDGVTSIGTSAFEYCDGLTNISIPNSVTIIETYAFYSCDNLTSITIPNSVSSIGYGAFASCDNLTSITIPNSVTSIGQYAFASCDNLTSIAIPNSVTSIGYYAFRYCTSLVSVNIGTGVKTIGDDTFRGCSSLTSINIPDNVTTIRFRAFQECSSLESVVIGAGVEYIIDDAFRYCYALKSVTCKPTTPPTGGSNMFEGISSTAKIYVPTGSGDAYTAKQYWSDYASLITEKNM